MSGVLDPRLMGLGPEWCSCEDAPWFSRDALTMLDHSESCGFPRAACTVREHRIFIHKDCSKPMPMRFCGCMGTGFTFDAERGWWVHYLCGWPTRAWFVGCGDLPREDLLGLKPVTFHEYVAVPQNPKKEYAKLSEEQQRINAGFAGSMVHD